MKLIRISSCRTFRPFHFWPKVYDGCNGAKTKLWVFGWVAIEFLPNEYVGSASKDLIVKINELVNS